MTNRILLAENSVTTRKVVELSLGGEDVELAIALTSEEGLKKAEEMTPHLILASSALPDGSGYKLCEEVRKRPSLSKVPFVLMVGGIEKYDEELGRSCGVTAWLSKPLDSQELLDLVAELMQTGSEAPATGGGDDLLVEERERSPEPPKEVKTPLEVFSPGQPIIEVPPPAEDKVEAESEFERSLEVLSQHLREIELAAPAEEVPVAGDKPEGPSEVEEEVAAEVKLELGEEKPTEPAERTPSEVREAEQPQVTVGQASSAAEAGVGGVTPETLPEDDVIRFIGKQVWQLTEQMVRDSLRKAVEQASTEIVQNVRDEVRSLFPQMVERIIREEIEKLKRELEG